MGAAPNSMEISSRHLLYTLVGWALHALFGVLILASGLVVATSIAYVLIATWVATVAYSIARWKRRAWIALAMALLSALGLFGAIFFDGVLSDWSG